MKLNGSGLNPWDLVFVWWVGCCCCFGFVFGLFCSVLLLKGGGGGFEFAFQTLTCGLDGGGV